MEGIVAHSGPVIAYESGIFVSGYVFDNQMVVSATRLDKLSINKSWKEKN